MLSKFSKIGAIKFTYNGNRFVVRMFFFVLLPKLLPINNNHMEGYDGETELKLRNIATKLHQSSLHKNKESTCRPLRFVGILCSLLLLGCLFAASLGLRTFPLYG